MPDPNPQHLQFIQNAIQRLAQNSFTLKGWCLTIISGLLALGAKDGNTQFAWVAVLPIAIFWCLDAYYLWRERQFRELYTRVARGEPLAYPFSMSVHDETHCVYRRSLIAATVWPVYAVMLVAVLGVVFFVKHVPPSSTVSTTSGSAAATK